MTGEVTAETSQKRCYERRRANNLCPRCGTPLNGIGFYCPECREKYNQYQRETRAFCRTIGICTICRKERVYGSDTVCFECRAKSIIAHEKSAGKMTDEQKEKAREKANAYQRSRYEDRKERGVCTRCGKRKAVKGRVKCERCLIRERGNMKKRYREGK